MPEEKTAKEKALEILGNRPDNWKCRIGDQVYDKATLAEEVGAGSSIGETATSLLTGLAPDCSGANQLGKRYSCMICGTTALATKTGGGRVSCCDQLMEVQETKPIPSSD